MTSTVASRRLEDTTQTNGSRTAVSRNHNHKGRRTITTGTHHTAVTFPKTTSSSSGLLLTATPHHMTHPFVVLVLVVLFSGFRSEAFASSRHSPFALGTAWLRGGGSASSSSSSNNLSCVMQVPRSSTTTTSSTTKSMKSNKSSSNGSGSVDHGTTNRSGLSTTTTTSSSSSSTSSSPNGGHDVMTVQPQPQPPQTSTLVEYVAETKLPTDVGQYQLRAYRVKGAPLGQEPCVIYSRDKPPFGQTHVPVRIHDQCLTSEVFRSQRYVLTNKQTNNPPPQP